MKKCKIYSTAQNKEADAVIIDKHVLVSAPQMDNVTPAKVIDGVCYYPPRYAADFARDMDYVPFSVKCEWGEYGECWKDYLHYGESEYAPGDHRPTWAIIYEVEDIPEKWGYCHAATGEISCAPQWERCDDFTDADFGKIKGRRYGVLDGTNMFLWPDYRDIIFAPDEVLLVQSDYSGLWGAYSWPDWDTYPAVCVEWDGIWYEDGFFTVLRQGEDGEEEYALLNAHRREPFIDRLTERPKRYVPEHWADYDGEVRFESYYLIRRGDELGLVSGNSGNGGTVMQEPTIIKHPVHTYNHLCRMVSRDMQETEIAYYAYLMSRTPKRSQACDGDGWDLVPEGIRDRVRKHMAEKDMTQPETAADL